MAHALANRVKESTVTTGTGTITLLGAATGYQSFAAIGNANTCYYTIAHQTLSQWEVGVGTYTAAGTTLSRDTIIASSAAGAAVNFSAGVKDVFVTAPTPQVLVARPDNKTALPGALVFSDASEQSSAGWVVPSGTALLFNQTAAPTGWTKVTTHNDKALRVVSGTVGSGGSVAFTTAFASQTPAGSVSVTAGIGTLATGIGTLAAGIGTLAAGAGTLSVGAGTLGTANATATGSVSLASGGGVSGYTLAVADMPSHNHSQYYSTNRNVNSIYNTRLSNSAENFVDSSSILYTGGSGSHSHGFTNPSYSFTGSAHSHTVSGSPSLSGSPALSGAPALSGSPSLSGAPSASGSFTGTAINLAVQYVDVIIATKN